MSGLACTPDSALESALQDYRLFYNLPAPSQSHGEHQIGYLDIEGDAIAVQTWQHPEPVGNVLLVHGYYDHVGLYGTIVRFCQSQQLNLVAFDLPGHGLSSGIRADIQDFSHYERVFTQVYHTARHSLKGRWFAIGQSTGGAILASYLLHQRPLPGVDGPDHVALLSPLLKPMGWRIGQYLTPVARMFIDTLPRHFRHDGNNLAFSHFLEKDDPLQSHHLSLNWVSALSRWIVDVEKQPALHYPLSLLQGDCDTTVDWQYNVPRYQSLFPTLQLRVMAGGHHHLVNETDNRLSELHQWLVHQLMT